MPHIMCAFAAPLVYSEIYIQSKVITDCKVSFYEAGKVRADARSTVFLLELRKPRVGMLSNRDFASWILPRSRGIIQKH
jgi:hypothetical protein